MKHEHVLVAFVGHDKENLILIHLTCGTLRSYGALRLLKSPSLDDLAVCKNNINSVC